MFKVGKQRNQSLQKESYDITVLQSQIVKLQERINSNISEINFGGCIHFAYYFSKKLNELNIPHKVFFGNYDSIDLRYEYLDSVNHVMIYIEGIGYIDGKKTLTSSPNYRYKRCLKVSEKKLNTMRKTCDWNNWYETSNNTYLSKLINKFIGDV